MNTKYKKGGMQTVDYDNNKKRKEQDEDVGMLKLAAFYLFMSALCAMMAVRLHQNGGVSLDTF